MVQHQECLASLGALTARLPQKLILHVRDVVASKMSSLQCSPTPTQEEADQRASECLCLLPQPRTSSSAFPDSPTDPSTPLPPSSQTLSHQLHLLAPTQVSHPTSCYPTHKFTLRTTTKMLSSNSNMSLSTLPRSLQGPGASVLLPPTVCEACALDPGLSCTVLFPGWSPLSASAPGRLGSFSDNYPTAVLLRGSKQLLRQAQPQRPGWEADTPQAGK